MTRKSKAAELDTAWDVTVSGRNVLVTDAMKNYAIEKISKIERFTNRIIDVHVTMDIQRQEHKVDIVMKLDYILIKASATTTDMYASVDMAVNKIAKQIKRYKSKLQEHQAKGLKAIDMRVNVFKAELYDELSEINQEIEEESKRELENKYKPHEIVEQETMPLKVLSNEEAIMKMELSGDQFLIFLGESDRNLKVIYRRKDGNYGIVEPMP